MRRMRRWLLPAAGASLGVAAIAVLLAGEALERKLDAAPPARGGATPARPAPVAAQVAPSPAAAAPAPLRAPSAPPPAPIDPRSRLRESPAVVAVSGELGALARAGDLPARLAWLDARLAALSPASSAALLSGLVDAPLPGDRYESEALRLAALARLGALRGPEVDAVLLARLDPERPRPERLVALELLAARPLVGARELEVLAAHDHDPVVRDKARWALLVRGGRG